MAEWLYEPSSCAFAGASLSAQRAPSRQQAQSDLNSQQAQQGSKPQQAQQDPRPQQGSSSGYASQDSQATEYALADRLTAGNGSQSVLQRQQDGLVSKVVSKLLPGSSTSRSQDSKMDSEAADYNQDNHYGGAWYADDSQNNSTGG